MHKSLPSGPSASKVALRPVLARWSSAWLSMRSSSFPIDSSPVRRRVRHPLERGASRGWAAAARRALDWRGINRGGCEEGGTVWMLRGHVARVESWRAQRAAAYL